MFDRKQQNSVKQLSFNKKINFKNKIKLQKKKIAGRNINNLRYGDDTTLMAEREEKEPLDEGERRQCKSWLKTQHSKN